MHYIEGFLLIDFNLSYVHVLMQSKIINNSTCQGLLT